MKNYSITRRPSHPHSSPSDQFNLLKIFGIRPDRNPIKLTGPGGETFTFHKTEKSIQGRYTLAEITFEAGPGPYPHIHHHEDEWIYIAEGSVGMAVGNDEHSDVKDVPGTTSPKSFLHSMIVWPGTLLYMPRYHVHTFSNEGLTYARTYTVWAPAGIENFFIAQVGLTPAEVSAMAPQYGLTFGSSRTEYVDSIVTWGHITLTMNSIVLLTSRPRRRRARH